MAVEKKIERGDEEEKNFISMLDNARMLAGLCTSRFNLKQNLHFFIFVMWIFGNGIDGIEGQIVC